MLVVQEVFRWLVQRYERAICLLAEARPFLPPSTTSSHVVTSPPLKSKMAAKQHVMFFLATIRHRRTKH
jgi:hypothetical protein